MVDLLKWRLILVVFIFAISPLVQAQQIKTNLINSWIGNSNANDQTFMPQGIQGMYVATDGTVYTNVYWEEGGGQQTEVKNGVVKHAWGSHGWGHQGGTAITANDKYVYYSQEYGNIGGDIGDTLHWAPPSTKWMGISRRNKSDITTGKAFPGGKGGYVGAPTGCFLPVFRLPDTSGDWNAGIRGLAASATELFASCPYDNKIRVFDANTMALKRSFPVTNPFHLALDSQGKLWVSIGFNATKIECYDANGIKQTQSVKMPSGSIVGSIAIDSNNRLLIGDVGQNEQVLIYTNIDAAPAQTSTFGTKFGIYSGVPGQVAPLKLHQVRGVGVDNAGNFYIGNTQWYTNGQGLVLESYTSGGTLNWSRYCVLFVDAASADKSTDGADIYGPVEHFSVDYSKPAGQEATLVGYTVNRYKYPKDPRLNANCATSYVKTLNGKKFLLMIAQNSASPICIFRFNAATDGEVAIPCVIWDGGTERKYPNAPNGNWMWRDLNANGQMDTGEYTSTEAGSSGSSMAMDSNGDIWLAAGDLKKIEFKGLDANGIPLFDGTYTNIDKPAPFTEIRRVRYYPKTDEMYLGGKTTDYPSITHWKPMGRKICKYNNWNTGNRTANFQIVVPFDNSKVECETASFDVAGDYIFTAISQGNGGAYVMGQINVYSALTGASVGNIRPPWNNIGWMDMVEPLSVTQRANGEYVILQEEDGRNKNIMYRWCPTGNCSGSCTTKVDSLALNFNKITLEGLTTKTLVASVYPDTVCNKEVFWKSMDENIVTVNKFGVITSLRAGSTWVKANSNQQANKADSCLVTVAHVAVSGISFENDNVKLPNGKSTTLKVNFQPIGAVNKNLTWKYSVENIVSIDENGLISGLHEGTTQIIASSSDGNFRDTCFLEVIPVPIESFKFKSKQLGLWVGDTQQIVVDILPQNAAHKNIEWLISNENIATVSHDGMVTGISIGETKLIAVSLSSGLKDTCLIKVLPDNKFANSDIGDVCSKGSFSEDKGIVTMTGSGADIWNFADGFHYAYKKQSNDVVIIARVISLGVTNEWAKAGVMIRETLDEGSKHAIIVVTQSHGTSHQYRPQADGESQHVTPANDAKAPYWVKLIRKGDSFMGYSSKDGVSWVLINTVSISMAAEINIGLCLTSHEKCIINTASFDHVIISENLDAIPDLTAIDAIMAANEFILYPNPATDFATIDFPNSLNNSKVSVQVVDLLGKEVYKSGEISQTPALQINTSQFNKGIYIVNILINSEKISKKLVIR